MSPTTEMRVDVFHHPDDDAHDLENDVRTGLTGTDKALPPKWFYDARGSELFDQITRLEEYYPTEAERAALRAAAPEIVEASGADTLVELGSGSSDKTRVLLDEMHRTGRLASYVPFDVSEPALRDAAAMIIDRYPGIRVHGVVGDFDHHLGMIPPDGTRLVAFLGGTIGNYSPVGRARLLSDIAGVLRPGETFLLGTDLVKDRDRLVNAYDDAAGITAAFNLNVLSVLNHELGADFDLDAFAHRAVWDPEREWIEMRLRSLIDQRVSFPTLDLEVSFERGEELRTEISAKFRREGISSELAAAGLELVGWWTDPEGDFAISLSRRAPG